MATDLATGPRAANAAPNIPNRPDTVVQWTTSSFSVDAGTALSGTFFADPYMLQLSRGGSSHPLPSNQGAALVVYQSVNTSVPGIGIYVTGEDGPGVESISTNSYGTYGLSTNSVGVYGQTAAGGGGAGVYGYSTSPTGKGVWAFCDGGIGVEGQSTTGIGGAFVSQHAQILLSPASGLGAPTSGAHQQGEIYLDSSAVMWLCVSNGTPGTWKQVVVVPSSGTITLQQSASGLGQTAIEGDGTSGAIGVEGTSDTNYGVSGWTVSSIGVAGQATGNGIGTYGQTAGGSSVAAVYGYATAADGKGIWGYCSGGTGIEGQSNTGIGGAFYSQHAQILLSPASGSGAPGSGTHTPGEVYLDNAAVMWVCVTGGTPGSWVRLTSVASGASGGALTFLSTPIRLLDTRIGASGAADTPNAQIQPGSANTFHLPVAGVSYGGVTIPTSAKALVGNCTVVNPAGVGDLAAYPDLLPLPNTAVMHYLTGQIVSNGITIGLGSNGKLAITALGSATDVIIDCQGFII